MGKDRNPRTETKGNEPVKAGLIGAGAEQHAGQGAIAIVGQEPELIGDGDVEELALVLQDAAEVPTRQGPGLERRVEAATGSGLAVAGPGARNPREGPALGGELDRSLGREIVGLLKGGRAWRRESWGAVAGETIVHQQCLCENCCCLGWLEL
jgi:hypothetical protein